jgi:HEAT repeat protein
MACDSLLSRTGGRFSSRIRLATTLSLLVLVEMASPGCMWEPEGPIGQVERPIQHAESPFRAVQFPLTQADIPSGISPELRSLIRDTFSPDARTRADAAKTLGDMGESGGPAARFVIRLVQDDAMLDVGGTPLEGREDASVASVACTAIAKIGTPAVDLLLAQLSHPVAEMRFSAVLGLERCTDPSVVLPLIASFNDHNTGVRFLAVLHFREHRDPRVVAPLLSMLNNHDTRRSAMGALGHQGDRRAAAPLLKIFRQTTDDDRDAAAYALGRIGDPIGLEALVVTLNDRRETPRMRMSVAGALGNAPDCGPAALESLTRILQDPGEIPALRGTVARALASIQGTKVVPLLSEMARRPSENDQVRFWAAMSVIQEVDGAIDDPLLLIPLQNGYVDLQVRSNLSALAEVAEDTENALAKVAKQGKTSAVRLAGSQVLAKFRQQRGQQPDDEKPHDPSGGQDAP